jgi:hypothetical protein
MVEFATNRQFSTDSKPSPGGVCPSPELLRVFGQRVRTQRSSGKHLKLLAFMHYRSMAYHSLFDPVKLSDQDRLLNPGRTM